MTKIIKTREELTLWLEEQKNNNHKIGFVPTMGALHEGHLSLLETAKLENDVCICSIFVNPTQFNNLSDLENYPKTEADDIALLNGIGCTAVFLPNVKTIYPDGEKTTKYDLGGIELVMEGEFRAGHFDGVATVVKRLFDLIQPTKSYFGEKDYQQLLVVKKMAEIEEIDVEVIGLPIFRESDGLAMSSRNTRLTEEFRDVAPLIYQVLTKVGKDVEHQSLEKIKKYVIDTFKFSDLKLEYFEICDESLNIITKIDKKNRNKYRAFIAAFAGEIRLIDNIKLG